MPHTGLLLLVFLAAQSSAWAHCSLYDLGCCMSQFSGLVTADTINLSERNVAAACTMKDEVEECMDLFLDQCLKNQTDKNEVEDVVNKTKLFMSEICPPSSDFMEKLKTHQDCIVNSSASFQACYNKTVVSWSSETDDARLKKDCCEYKDLRNCAIQAVENKCGATASQLIHEEIVHMNGAVLEWVCSDVFSECGNSAVMLASSALFALYSFAVLKLLL